jgi:dTDP-4-dehydrorhamnose 3,5-epimerase
MHLQMQPFAQAKLIRVCYGEIIDVAVDCRPASESFGKHVAVRLSGKNKRQLWIPEGFAHGFQVLSDECTVNYLVNAPRNANAEIEINCFDKDLAINWRAGKTKIMSEKDQFAKSFIEASGLFADAN